MGARIALDAYVRHGHDDLGAGDWVWMSLMMIGVILTGAVVVLFVARSLLNERSQTRAPDGAGAGREPVRRTTEADAAVAELRLRLARGEISVAEYDELLGRLGT